MNTDNDGIPDGCDPCPLDPLNDSDGDGVCDGDDSCPQSDLGATIVIDGCETGVTNQMVADGCSMMDLIAACSANAGNHGAFVSYIKSFSDVVDEKRPDTWKGTRPRRAVR